MHTKFWLENLEGGDRLKDLGVDGKIILECILGSQYCKLRTGFILLRIGTSGSLFTVMNHKMWGIS